MRRPATLTLAALSFFASGSAALVYQVAWQRILALHTGVGIYSVSLIVGSFLAGLGVGSPEHQPRPVSARRVPERAVKDGMQAIPISCTQEVP